MPQRPRREHDFREDLPYLPIPLLSTLGLASRIAGEDDLASLIADDWAALVAHPIREAEIVYPHVVKSGAHRRGCAQCRPAAAFAVGHDVIARAEPHLLKHGTQCWRRPNNAIIQQIDMRQMPGAREMAAAGPLAHVLAGELGAGARVEHMRFAVQLTLEGLPINQSDGP